MRPVYILEILAKMRPYSAVVVCGALLTFLVSCSSTQPALTFIPRADGDVVHNYLISPEDVLDISVWKNQTLSQVVSVRPDGKISLPLIGDLQAEGKTAVQLKDDIVEGLKPYYKDVPEVSVIVKQVNSSIYVLGEVQRPGKYVLKSDTTVIQAIALAGGLTQYASPNNIILLRHPNSSDDDGKKEEVLKIRYKDITSGENLETNVLLKTGDTIIVH